MRRVLVDHARRAGEPATRFYWKAWRVYIQNEVQISWRLTRPLKALEQIDPRKCSAFELRYFGGLSMEEIAQAPNISQITVRRDLRAAEAWLYREMRAG